MLDKVEQPAGLQAFGMYINGASVGASNGKIMESLNPYSGKPWATVPDGSKEDINAAVAAASESGSEPPQQVSMPNRLRTGAASGKWRRTSFTVHSAVMRAGIIMSVYS